MRRLLLLTGNAAWCHGAAQRLLDQWQDTLWLTTTETTTRSCPASSARRFLGREFDAVVYDLHAGFDPDALGAIAGTIRDEGAFLLLAPPLAEWPAFDDPEYARIDAWMPVQQAFTGRALTRLRDTLLEASDLVQLQQESGEPPTPLPLPARRETRSTNDQQKAIEAVCHVARGHAKRPLVLTADRGRGKSAALGLAAALLLQEGKQRLVVTAPVRSAVEPVFRHALEALPDAEQSGENAILRNQASLRFLPPDELLRSRPDADLLLVDEAAAIPAPLLEGLLKRYNRVVFSTTVHGYEGTGRGFAIRFRKSLDRMTPQWRELTLQQPIRWPAGDPLEAFVTRALLLDAEPARPEAFENIDIDKIDIAAVSQDDLLEDDRLLGQLFGLLVSAHYQTRPRDLRRLLDAANLDILVARHDDAVAGVVLAVREGGFDADLSANILAGRRRPRGNLAPQSLGLHLQEPGFLEAGYLRIMRIAVHHALQGRGLGKRLVERLAGQGDGADLLATSFGATADLVQFWKACGFTPARMGIGRDAASGSHSLLMLRSLGSRGEALRSAAQSRFHALLPLLLPTELAGLESDLACELMRKAVPDGTLTMQQIDRLRRFIDLGLPRDTVLPELDALVRLNAETGRLLDLSEPARSLLVELLLQQKRPHQVVRSLGLGGKRELDAGLQCAVGELLEGTASP